MTHMMLVRHGEANSGARDEASYDRLSDLGHQQAEWLGDHLASTGMHFTRVYCGTMRRHQETAEGMRASQFGEIICDPRLNEFPYFSLAAAYERQTGAPIPMTREGFAAQLEDVLRAWSEDQLIDVEETFAQFTNRVTSVIKDIAQGHGPALVVTSGGLISTVLRDTLTLDTRAWARMCLAIYNTSTHHWQPFMEGQLLTQFNNTAHLDRPDRRHALTHL